MMYQNKLVACLKVNGRILREQHGTVLIPFGSEYSIFLKNLNTVRVKVKIAVDGQDATSGTWLVIPPNSTMELERFIKDGNWSSGNRFKFIARTGEIEAHRGIKADDGIVRVEYATERRVVDVPVIREYDVPVPRPWYPPHPYYPSMQPQASANGGGASAGNFQNYSAPIPTSAGDDIVLKSADAEVGITVAGSVSHQSFHAVSDFPTDQSDVMILQLRGIVRDEPVTQAVTVNDKLTCSTCGKTFRSDVAFCASCGTALQIV